MKLPIVSHHHPLDEHELPEMTALLHLANHLGHVAGSGCMQGETFSPLVQECYGLLALNVSEENLMVELTGLLREAEPFFSLIEAN